MPSKTLPDGSHRDTAHPINKETRKLFEDLILDAYNNMEE
jgi:stage V sporulation protein G